MKHQKCHVADIPGDIVRAICLTQSAIGAVKKTGRNSHGGYDFASTDDIYAEVTHKMAQNGLSVLCLEDDVPEIVRLENKKGEMQQWGKFSFSFMLATADACWHDDRNRRSLFIQILGPQTFQAAQSYADKCYLRSLFKLPTGDMDLDAVAETGTENKQAALNGNGTKRKSSYAAKKDGTDKKFNEIRTAIAEAPTRELLREVREAFAEDISALPAKWGEIIEHELEDRVLDLPATQ